MMLRSLVLWTNKKQQDKFPQYALLNECWRLVRDGVVSAQDLDVVMKAGKIYSLSNIPLSCTENLSIDRFNGMM